MSETEETKSEFERQAQAPRSGIVTEFWEFLRYNKKWWLTPIVIVTLTFGALILLGGSAAAPFVYTLF